MNRCKSFSPAHTSMILLCCVLLGLPDFAVARSGLQSEESAPPFKVQKCRISCLEKVCASFFFSIFLKYIVKRVKIYLCCGNCVFLSASSLDRVFCGDKENPNKIDILSSSPRKTEAYVKRIDIDPFLSDLLIVSLLLCSCCVFACLPSSTAVRDSLRMDPKSSFRVFLR